jgi:hypothetical protein
VHTSMRHNLYSSPTTTASYGDLTKKNGMGGHGGGGGGGDEKRTHYFNLKTCKEVTTWRNCM